MLRIKQTIGMLIAYVLPAVLAACSASAQSADLDGTEWVLTSLNGRNLIPGTDITLNFDQGKATGFAGCNAYGGPYTASEGTLKIDEFTITVMACLGPEGVMQQEKTYTEALRNAAAYRMVGDRLEIANNVGVITLAFAKKERLSMNPRDLIGKQWRLVSMNGNAPIEGSMITLVFVNENQVNGHAGCRNYSATYTANGDAIKFPRIEMLGDVCLSTPLLEQEEQYTTILEWADQYHLSEDKLEISTMRGEMLVYVPLAK
jgi:heat shock protein HslJ